MARNSVGGNFPVMVRKFQEIWKLVSKEMWSQNIYNRATVTQRRTHTYQPRPDIPLSLKVKSRHLRSSGLQLKASRYLQTWHEVDVTDKWHRQSKYYLLLFDLARNWNWKRKFTNYLLINIAFIRLEWICIVEVSIFRSHIYNSGLVKKAFILGFRKPADVFCYYFFPTSWLDD